MEKVPGHIKGSSLQVILRFEGTDKIVEILSIKQHQGDGTIAIERFPAIPLLSVIFNSENRSRRVFGLVFILLRF